MKKKLMHFSVAVIVLAVVSCISFAFGRQVSDKGYILEHEKDLAKEEPGTHKGNGMTTGYNFFAGSGAKIAFRKRVLKPGSSIGYHLQKEDEIYYVLSGTGKMKMNDAFFTMQAGDGVLTRPGSSHGLEQTGAENLVIIICYQLP